MLIARITLIGFALVALTGCLGGNTYGTGVSQETQLLKDVGGLMMLGGGDEKKVIDYSARSELIRPGDTAALPAPVAEQPQTEAGYFPTDPEERRAAIRARGDDFNRRSGSLNGSGRVAGISPEEGPAVVKPRLDSGDLSGRGDAPITDLREQRKQRAAVLEAKKRLAGASGSKERRYLTDPPNEYRQPAATAAVGEVGERERKEKKKTEEITAFNPQS